MFITDVLCRRRWLYQTLFSFCSRQNCTEICKLSLRYDSSTYPNVSFLKLTGHVLSLSACESLLSWHFCAKSTRKAELFFQHTAAVKLLAYSLAYKVIQAMSSVKRLCWYCGMWLHPTSSYASLSSINPCIFVINQPMHLCHQSTFNSMIYRENVK